MDFSSSCVGTCLLLPLLGLSSLVTAFASSDRLETDLAAPSISTISERASNFNASTIPLAFLDSTRTACPTSCNDTGLDSINWPVYDNPNRLSWCNQTMLLDFALFNSLNDPQTRTKIRCCTADSAISAIAGAHASVEVTASRIAKRAHTTKDKSCVPNVNQNQIQAPLQMAFNRSDASASVSDFMSASQQMASYLAQQDSSCQDTISFTYSGSAAVGFFAGAAIQSQGIAESVLQQFIASVENSGYSKSILVQLCSGNMSSRYSMGIIANSDADVGYVQNAVATWASGSCVTSYDTADTWKTVTLSTPTPMTTTNQTISNGTSLNGTHMANNIARALAPRTTCSTVQVASGDTCSSLATECGITPAEFTEYNPSSTLCSTLMPGEHVCCSAGTLPDFSPQPNANGTCATYLVQSGDTCSAIAATYSLTLEELADYNNDTWGWMGCDDLQAAETMCLSTGSLPMPAVIRNAVCGPQVPGTPLAAAGTNLSTLNQCPLNACCDIWGQCGTTSEFCTESRSPTGAPGTAAEGTNGCISNCGTEIVTGSAPSAEFKVGYFEGYNLERPCLNQLISSVDLSAYTHVHLAFAEITTEFALDVSSIQAQFDEFITLSGFKKILSVGGWAFCTDPSTYAIFRDAVTSANRDTFAANIASFIEMYDLDGIDIDWEYPGEPDIPGIPAGTAADGSNYLAFLETLSTQMPDGTTISFTAPASFWYLKAFEVSEMATHADYIVYMTYDLHGQWDYGNKWSNPGCPGGNCLRSDVNLTETISALSMITKAGVPANKIVVGVTSYGRSFQMTTAGCYAEMCTYTGPSSGAYAGVCTQTGGYISNAEIAAIIAGNATVTADDGSTVGISGTPITYHDSNSDSDIVVYDETQWIGYMTENTKASRASLYQGYNFLGTADWAVDLQSFDGDSGSGQSSTVVSVSPSIWTSGDPSIACDPPCIFVLPPFPLGFTSTITWPTLTTTLLSSLSDSIMTITTTISVPDFTITDLSLQPITIGPSDTATYEVNPVQSVTPTSFILTLGPNEATFPPTAIPTSGASVGGPPPGTENPEPTSSSTSGGAVIPVGVTFYTTPFPVTIQPQPTYSITIPPLSTPVPHITISTGKPKPSCSGSGCGSRHCGIFGCSPGCGLFGCDGGCGIFGCGGGCGPFGCVAACPLDACGGLGCVVPGSCGGAEGGGDGDGDPNDECDQPVTVSACTYIVSSFSTAPMTEYSTTTSTSCSTTTTCDGADTATTETAGACSASITNEYASDALAVGTMVSGTLVPTVMYITDTPGATGSPDASYFGFSLSSTTSNCDACWWLNGDEVYCSAVYGCTQSTVGVSTTTITPTTTVTVVPPPSATADCASWIFSEDIVSYYIFEIYNIDGWATDGGHSLHKQEDGCGALTGWTWDAADPENLASATFNLPLLIKSGCVERAVVSAGGPKLHCQYQGTTNKKRRNAAISEPPTLPSQTVTPNYTYSTTFSSIPAYTPMTWDTGDTVTLTYAYTTVSTPDARARAYYDFYAVDFEFDNFIIIDIRTGFDDCPVIVDFIDVDDDHIIDKLLTTTTVTPPGHTQS